MLHIACRCGYPNIVQQIVDLRPDLVVVVNEYYETPRLEACRGGSLEVLEILLQAKPWTFQRSYRKSALILACQYGHGHLLKRLMTEMTENSHDVLLISSKFAVDFSSLRIAVSGGYEEFIRDLIEACPGLVEGSDDEGHNLLHYACEYGESDIARMLLTSNPKLARSYDKDGLAPLHKAVWRNKIAIFKEFKAFAPFAFTALTKKKETLFHFAVENDLVDAFISLVQVIGDSYVLFDEGDQLGNHHLHLAVHHKSVKVH